MHLPKREWLDGIWAAAYQQDGSRVDRLLYQPSRPAVLDAVRTMRNEGIVEDRPNFQGRWCLSIPHEDWERLRRHPRWRGLHSRNSDEMQKTFREFLVHPDSAIYRVRERAS